MKRAESHFASLTDIFHASNDDPDRVRLLADDLRDSPELLNVLRDHPDRREKIRRNQSIGAAVEQLLKRLLGVTRTPRGTYRHRFRF